MIQDAYWTIFRNDKEVWVWDEVKDTPVRRHCKILKTEEEAEQYIEDFLKEWKPKIAILDRI